MGNHQLSPAKLQKLLHLVPLTPITIVSTLRLAQLRLIRIDEAKVLLTMLIIFQVVELRLKTLKLSSGRLAMFKKQLLILLKCDDEVVSVALSFAETFC